MSDPSPAVDFSIRDANLGDVAALASLLCKLGYQTTETEMTGRMQAILPNSQYQTLVAVVAGQVCGMIGSVCYPGYEHNDPSAHILALIVSDAMRGRGIGQKLIEAAESSFAQKKITRIAVNTRLVREDAHRFYVRSGYTKNGFRFVKNFGLTDNWIGLNPRPASDNPGR